MVDSKVGWGKGEGWGQREGEGVVLLARRRPWALVVRGSGVVLSVGVRHAGVARRCLWEGRRRPWGVLVVRACVGVVLRGWGLFSVHGHCRLWGILVVCACVGVVVHGWGLFSVHGRCRLWALGGPFVHGRHHSWALSRCPWALDLCLWVLGCRS